MYKLILALVAFSTSAANHHMQDNIMHIQAKELRSLAKEKKIICLGDVKIQFKNYMLHTQKAEIVFSYIDQKKQITDVLIPTKLSLIYLDGTNTLIANKAIYCRKTMLLKLDGEVKMLYNNSLMAVDTLNIKIDEKLK